MLLNEWPFNEYQEHSISHFLSNLLVDKYLIYTFQSLLLECRMSSGQSAKDWMMMWNQAWVHDSQSQRNRIDDEYTKWMFRVCNYLQTHIAIDFGSTGTF